MSCPRPLDTLDLEALASGEAPLFAPDAREHATGCSECGSRLAEARELAVWLAEIPSVEVPARFASAVERLRAFSRREKWSVRLWGPPVAVVFALFAASAVALTLPVLRSSEHAHLLAALLAALLAEERTVLSWPGVFLRALPAEASALAEVLRSARTLSAASILLLIPFGLAARRLFARRRV
jgi:hypothetical protein